MWYGSGMNPQNIVGKPLVVYIDGDRRQIGTITKAAIKDGTIYVAAGLGNAG